MNIQAQRDLQLLNEVERNAAVTQRSLARNLGVAVGLANLYLKRLVRKGHIKITTIPKHRIKYLLTPRGMAEKSRLTYLYMQYSLSYYRKMRERLKHVLTGLSVAGAKRIAVYGTGELAELAYLTLREMDMTQVGFVEDKHERTFLSAVATRGAAELGVRCRVDRRHGTDRQDPRHIDRARDRSGQDRQIVPYGRIVVT